MGSNDRIAARAYLPWKITARAQRRLLTLFFIILFSPATPAAECTATNSVPPGPNYRPVDRHAVDVSSGLVISGQILEVGSCRPIPQAKIVHWQPSARGDYDDALRAYLYSDAQGRYAFSTEWPSSLVPHIYFMVEAEGYQTVITQWVGDLPVDKTQFDVVLTPER